MKYEARIKKREHAARDRLVSGSNRWLIDLLTKRPALGTSTDPPEWVEKLLDETATPEKAP